MIQLRGYQVDIAKKGLNILKEKAIVYLAMEVRTGKTLTAFEICKQYDAKKVLFLTKKRAVESGTIRDDYDKLECNFKIKIINNESLHKVTDNDFDLIISDEHHRNSSYPKPNKTTKEIKHRFGDLPMIFLSGTPAIESGSQWYHTFWISYYSPFTEKSFYKWADLFVNKRNKHIGARTVIDYSQSRDELILPIIEPYLLKYTQKEAGFSAEIEEKVLYYDLPINLSKLVDTILKDEIIVGKYDNVVADTAAGMLNKVHQITNGTVICESGATWILDNTKAEFIKQYFRGKKIAIFYYFQKEKELIQAVYGNLITTDIHEFNSTNKSFLIQQISGSEAISLKEAECLVYYNFGYSGKNYTQGRDRMTTKEREQNNVYFVMSKDDINSRIYKAIKAKKRYNEKLFLKDYGTRTKVTK